MGMQRSGGCWNLPGLKKRPIDLVMARPGDVKAVVDEHPASDPGNCFAARPDLVGELSHFDGDTFVIDFRKRS